MRWGSQVVKEEPHTHRHFLLLKQTTEKTRLRYRAQGFCVTCTSSPADNAGRLSYLSSSVNEPLGLFTQGVLRSHTHSASLNTGNKG